MATVSIEKCGEWLIDKLKDTNKSGSCGYTLMYVTRFCIS